VASTGSLLDALDQVMQDKYMRELFHEYLVSKLSSEVLMFYIACLEYESVEAFDQRVRVGQSVWASFFTGHQKMQIAVDFELKTQVRVSLASGSPDLFEAVKQEQRDCLINFLLDFRSEYSSLLQVEVKNLVKDLFSNIRDLRIIRACYTLPKSIYQTVNLLAEASTSRVTITTLLTNIKRSGISFLDFFDPSDAKASSFSLTHLHVWSCFLPTCSRFLKYRNTDEYQDFLELAIQYDNNPKSNILNRLSKTLSGRSTTKKKLPAMIDLTTGEIQSPASTLPVASHVPYQYPKKKRLSAPNLSTYTVPVDDLKHQEKKASSEKTKRVCPHDAYPNRRAYSQGDGVRGESSPADATGVRGESSPLTPKDHVKRGSSQNWKATVSHQQEGDNLRKVSSYDDLKAKKINPSTGDAQNTRETKPISIHIHEVGRTEKPTQRKATSISPRRTVTREKKSLPDLPAETEQKQKEPVEVKIPLSADVALSPYRTQTSSRRPKLVRCDSKDALSRLSGSPRESFADDDNLPLEGGSGGSDESEIRKKLNTGFIASLETVARAASRRTEGAKRSSVDTPAGAPYGLHKVNRPIGAHLIRAKHPLLLKPAETKLQSLEYLFSLVITGAVNAITVSNIILAIPHFMNPALIIPIIEKFYSNPVSDQTSFHTMSLVKQIIIFLSNSYFPKPESSGLLTDLIQKIQKDHPKHGQHLSEFFETHNAQKVCQTLAQQTNKLSSPVHSDNTRLLNNFNLGYLSQQLCIFDQKNYQNIDISEFHRSKYLKVDETKIGTLLKLQGNLVNQLVQETIQISTKTANTNELSNLISLGWKLLQLRNFQSLRAIYLALEKILLIDPKAIKHVSKKWQGIKDTIDMIFNPDGGYSHYWILLEQDSKYIPSLELDLVKLQFIQLGPNFLGEKRVDLNTNKIQTMGELISVYIRSQQYEFPAEPEILCVLQAIHDLPKLKEFNIHIESPSTSATLQQQSSVFMVPLPVLEPPFYD